MLGSLRSKLTLVYLAIVALIALVGALSMLNIAAIHASIENIMRVNYKSIQYAQGMMYILDRQNEALIAYISAGDEASETAFFGGIQSFDNYITDEKNSISQQKELELVGDLHDRYIRYQKSFSDLKLIRQTQGDAQAFEFYRTTVLPVYSGMVDDINNISLLNQQGLTGRKEKTSSLSVWSLYVLFSATLLAVLGGLFIARHFANRLLKPLQELTRNICQLSSGKLNLKLDIRTNDEIGRLAREFNNMTGRLSVYEQSTKGELLKEKNQSLAIVRSISDPLIVLDAHFRITLVNQAGERFFGIREETAAGRHFLECIQNGALFDVVSACAESGDECRERIVTIERPDGDWYFNVVAAPVRSARDGGFIFLMQNVTELKRLERAKNDFISTISHEFKTPLTMVTMGVSMLQSGRMGALDDGQKEIVSTISEYSENLIRLVDDLLELAKIDSGKALYRFQPCDIEEILRGACHLFEEKAKTEGIGLACGCDGPLPAVTADAGRLSYVLNNLLSNAFRYTPAGGHIRVSAEPDRDGVAVTVEDDGEGIPPEFIDRIFDQFVQGEQSDVEARGTGLGLYASRQIIRAHGGEITVKSRPGEGSRFSFTLPAGEEEET